MSVTHDPDVTDFEPMVEAVQAAGGNPTGLREPEEVAEAIWTAANDGSDRLGHVVGEGATRLLGERFSIEQDEASVGRGAGTRIWAEDLPSTRQRYLPDSRQPASVSSPRSAHGADGGLALLPTTEPEGPS